MPLLSNGAATIGNYTFEAVQFDPFTPILTEPRIFLPLQVPRPRNMG